MEFLDIYDEDRNYLGKEDRKVVHEKALWHNTVHCWLYDKSGNVYFQIRKDLNKLYTTASGHIKAGESLEEGFGREIDEEIGVKLDYSKALLTDVVKFRMDREKSDGSVFRDRAFANVFVFDFTDNSDIFNFDLNEVVGLVKVNAKDCLNLLSKEDGIIKGTLIKSNNGENLEEERDISFLDFLVNPGETGINKYGDILNKVIELTSLENDYSE